MPRTVADIDAAITTVHNRQQAKINARDRRERDMLSALHDLETYEQQIRDDTQTIDDLLVERAGLRTP
jgi:hypothetical protein